MSIDMREGTGRIFVNTNIVVGKTWQNSAKTAVDVAQALTHKDLSSKDITFTVAPTNSSGAIATLDGDSSGAAMTVLLASELEGKTINNYTVMTGAIKADGTIGMVAGVLEKATAAGRYGAKVLLVPAGQAYYPDNSCLSQGNSDRTDKQTQAQICLLEEKSLADLMDRRYDMKVVEIHSIQEALSYYQLNNVDNQAKNLVAVTKQQEKEQQLRLPLLQQQEQKPFQSSEQERKEGDRLGKNNSPIINLSNSTGWSSFSKPNALLSSNSGFLASSGSNVYAVWVDNSTGTLGSHDIMLARSTDDGQSFERPIDLSFPLRNNGQTFGFSHSPQIVAVGDTVYVVWIEFTYAPSSENLDSAVLYARSFDGGRTFQGPFNTMRDYGCLGIAEPKKACLPMLITDPRLVMDGNNNNNDVYATWTSKILAPAYPSPSSSNPLTKSQGRTENDRQVPAGDVFFTAIGSNGATEPANLSDDAGDSQTPRIALSGSNAYVAWTDNNSYGSTEVLLKRIAIAATDTANNSDGAISEQRVVNVSNSLQQDDNDQPELAAVGNSVYITWQHSERDSNGQEKSAIYFASSHDNGTTFSDPASIAATSIPSTFGPRQSIAVVKDNDASNEEWVYVVWTDGMIGKENVYFSRINGATSNGSETFSSPYSSQPLTTNSKALPFVQMSLSENDAINVAWTESTSTGTSIYYSTGNITSAKRGESDAATTIILFSTPAIISSDSMTRFAYNPQLASGKDHAYIGWEGRYSNNTMPDIYFKRFPS